MTYGKPMSMILTARRIIPLQRRWLWKSERLFNLPGIISERWWAVIFNMLGNDFYKLPPDEQKILKRILSKAPNIKNSPFNFRRKRK